MWYRAAEFPTPEAMRVNWRALHNDFGGEGHISYISAIWMGHPLVIAFELETPPLSVQRIIERHLRKGKAMTLPAEFVADLRRRRIQKIGEATVSKKRGLIYEDHNFKPVSTSAPQGETSETDYERHMQLAIETYHKAGYPFVETYKSLAEYSLQQTLQLKYEYAPHMREKAVVAFRKQLDVSAKYLFTESARSMHTAVMTGENEWIENAQNLWIEHDAPEIVGSFGKRKVKAIYCAPIESHVLTPTYRIVVIDELAQNRIVFLYETTAEKYYATFDYECPFGKCEDMAGDTPQGTLVARYPCTQCQQEAEYWSKWLHTAKRMIRRDYATTPDPVPFEQGVLTFTEKKLMPRVRGKGKPKLKEVETKQTYTIVKYDVSVAPQQRRSERHEETGEKRENWLTLYGKEDIILVRRNIPTHDRVYRAPHFKPLIDRCRQKATQDGRAMLEDDMEYRFIHGEQEDYVIGKVIYPQGKYVPMLKQDVRKKHVYKKVTAKGYEHG